MPAAAAFDGEACRAGDAQAELQRSDVSDLRGADLVHATVGERRSARPGAPRSPRCERRQPGQSRQCDVGVAGGPVGPGGANDEAEEPAAVWRKVAPLRVERSVQPCARLVGPLAYVPPAKMRP